MGTALSNKVLETLAWFRKSIIMFHGTINFALQVTMPRTCFADGVRTEGICTAVPSAAIHSATSASKETLTRC